MSATQTPTKPDPSTARRPKPILSGRTSLPEHVTVSIFVILPLLTLAAAVPFAWGWGLSWLDIGLGVAFFVLTGLGVTVGYHRHFTHGSFKAKRPLKIALAIAGNMAAQGSTTTWVADHRRHHAFSDRAGDPHSPWRYGTGARALAKGFWHAHMGWLFNRDVTNAERFAPDLVADPDIRAVDRLFPVWTAATFLLPALIGGLATWSVWGGVTALFWAGFVRVALLHHVTWSVNSICHMIGERPFSSRDKAANFWPLAIFSFGESWHNLHHADPTCARHGVLRGQIDISARLIWIFEKLGWATNVRWPTPARLHRITASH
ncbi:stearoyl-CoA desaturase (delta-9 desaturase) [Amycolatopsis arida]|uniref:Stearoyl-CoA desaturase (Delta-9 desaturase) n=1 Tax=Amycolatopsis arida TaxID=587909 RepID=A0A1I5SLH3_9PSEU|nr:acyl-CoA desaturase [Amycolatopsis arida]TDX96436.1 stearoyl-CoA desaturase (delta-9 desaturase) [Amycolatopsis arida]SFP71568.1 stearoyl-CoA desaturase (delta-9 desaturase) [Amycolatopsis arida]